MTTRLYTSPRTVSTTGYDAYRSGDDVVLAVDLPGIDAGSLEVTVDGDVLQISATRTAPYGEGDRVLSAGRRHGDVRRSLRLGKELDREALRADYRDGVLTLTVPVLEKAQPRRIEVATGTQELPAAA